MIRELLTERQCIENSVIAQLLVMKNYFKLDGAQIQLKYHDENQEICFRFEPDTTIKQIRDEIGQHVHCGSAKSICNFENFISEIHKSDNRLLLEISNEKETEKEICIISELHDDINIIESELINAVKTVLNKLCVEEIIDIDCIDMMSQEQKERILSFKGDRFQILSEQNYISEFQKTVEKYPDKTAVVYEDSILTYRQLSDKVNQVSRLLKSYGVEKEDTVVVVEERTDKMLISILAIWKSGGVYVPVDGYQGMERINGILHEVKPKVIIYDETIRNDFELNGLSAVLLEKTRLFAESANLSTLSLEQDITHEQLAYIIFTSGSTGKPKGAMVEHLGMINHMLAKIKELGLDESAVIVQNASQCFDISVWQFCVALLTGGTTLIVSNDTMLNLYEFSDILYEKGVTDLEVVPSFLDVMLDLMDLMMDDEDIERRGYLNLKHIIVTGERLPSKLVKKWFRMFPKVDMMNAYGPTEAADDITHYIMNQEPQGDDIPVGHAILNMNIYILDKSNQLCPIGVTGEICVSGAGVGRGYINNREQTNKVFVNNIFEDGYSRLYHTGDFGRWMSDGNIKYRGRLDEQVKVHGFRIELGDVRALILKHPAIKDAVVVCKTKENDEKYLCAYIISSEHISDEQVSETMKQYGPYYMVPEKFVYLNIFPLTENGKIDTKKLASFE